MRFGVVLALGEAVPQGVAHAIRDYGFAFATIAVLIVAGYLLTQSRQV